MRLSPHYQQIIKKYFFAFFGSGEIYLFGSRADDTKKGDDIDLYLSYTRSHRSFSKKDQISFENQERTWRPKN